MPNLEWEVQHDLVTPGGTVIFNVPEVGTDRLWQLLGDDYAIVPTLRATDDNISQQSGTIVHPRWKTGLIATLHVKYLKRIGGSGSRDYEPACGEDLRVMNEKLIRALDSITNLSHGNQRLIWTPSSATPISRRMLDQVVVSSWPTPSRDGPETGVTFAVETPFPYAIDFTQIATVLGGGGVTITNPGDTPMWPVIQVDAATAWTLTNDHDLDVFGNPKTIVYDSTRPGAIAYTGYAELDFFRGTIFRNGDDTDLTAGIDPIFSDFWRIMPGVNTITCDSPGTMLWNPSWA